MTQARIGAADLLRLQQRAPADADRLARAFGYHRSGDERGNAEPSRSRPAGDDRPAAGRDRRRADATDATADANLAAATCWQPVRLESVPSAAEGIARADVGPVLLPRWDSDPGRQPDPDPLARWRELLPALRRRLAERVETDKLDVAELTRRLGRGQAIVHLPRRRQRRWGRELTLVEDRSARLTPYWEDQAAVAARLAGLYPGQALGHGLIWDGARRPEPFDPDQSADAIWPPTRGSRVLVLGDLGGLAAPDIRARWIDMGHELADLECEALALSPLPASLYPARLRRCWRILPWERRERARGGRSLHADAARLLAALGIATRIEPGLLRAVRLALGLPAAVEALVWQAPQLSSRSSVAATLRATTLPALREDFVALPAEQQALALRQLFHWRGGLPAELWFAEIQALPRALRPLLPEPGDAVAADAYFAALGRRLRGIDGSTAPAGLDAWYRFIAPRLRSYHLDDAELGIHFQRLYRLAFGDRAGPVPKGYDPRRDEPPITVDPHTLCLYQRGSRLSVTRRDGRTEAPEGSPLALVESVNDELVVEPMDAGLGPDDFWADGQPPPWAARWGEDAFGPWVEFDVPNGNRPADGPAVVQRMRWMPPGEFVMGSPEDEPGRWDDEGPQHAVRITEGFWLFDTPCTQALWQVVMGENPSWFQDPERPVEQVSWDDVQGFLDRLNQRVPGLGLTLPSEARWEYACRAGNSGAIYRGSLGAQGDASAEDLSQIAWFYDNSGDGFDLKTDADGDAFSGGTRKVRQKRPNDWGLYDMLGNVWEWTQDRWHDSYVDAPVDGTAWETGDDADRVVRGGSWGSLARFCRCAARLRLRPVERYDYLGFRCARVQGELQSGQDQASGAPSRPVGAPRGSGSGRADGPARRGAGGPALLLTDGARVVLPKALALLIRGDREQLRLRRIARPDWASAIGRDRFGLWSEFRVEDTSAGAVVQRLRWIPPGRFKMGSPPDEPGRFDSEGPTREVRIGDGFWLFDTPCTQALWQAVMGANPSKFTDPLRPVEQVSWEDAHGFIERINAMQAGLELSLPSEAQWEYACRAGTDTALYTGPIDLRGDADAPALDAIAWYGGNSADGFELDNGIDLDYLQQRAHQGKAGTRRVKGKASNPWGLYDMLGNVWEWVEDGWHADYDDAPMDGSARFVGDDADRVVRGGSWCGKARDCRCATRNGYQPVVRRSGLGFRCARVQP